MLEDKQRVAGPFAGVSLAFQSLQINDLCWGEVGSPPAGLH